MNNVIRTLDELYLGNTITQWSWAVVMATLVLLTSMLIRRIGSGYYLRLRATAERELMEVPLKVISRTATTFLLVISASIGIQFLTVNDRVQHVAEKVALIAACWQVGIWISTGAMAWLEHKREYKLQQDRAVAGSINIIAVILRAVIWVVVLLLTLDNLGVNITALVAGLGIGGIAVALAIQNVLGDLLASLAITLDKPFIVGDALMIDDINGTVEQIGLKTTRLRSVNGEQIIMANADLLKSRVRNFGRMHERRVVAVLQVAYDTPHEKLAAIATVIQALIVAQHPVRFERCHLARLSMAAIEFEIVYFVLTADYTICMDVQQAVNLGIVDYFAREGIKFAQATPQLILKSS
jgi:small-conductance mechanosensitive channel